MPDATIVSACRTAIGTARKGTLVDSDPFDLARHVVAEALGRARVDTALVDDVILGETLAGGGDIARHAAIEAGIVDAPGTAVNRHCASGLAAIAAGAGSIRAGMDRVVVAGGVQSSTLMPRTVRRVPGTDELDEQWMSPSHPDSAEAPNRDMTITVGWNAAQRADVTRREMDAWALASHQKAVAAIDAKAFLPEITPFPVRGRDGSTSVFDVDEHPRRDTTLEKLASLKPLHPEIDGFSITAGNSAGVNDGAAALVLASSDVAKAEGLAQLATVRAWASVGVPPVETGLAPVKAIPKALERAGLGIDDVDLFEINEAFASVCVATTRRLGIDPARVNPNGSGCSLGHPIAMTGTRMVTTLVYELRRRGGGFGVAAMCAGGGMGTALVVEV
ncbi:MAG TPA: thiolase family protein [Acidimicrobiales bacterium]|nr:thiolase family protein [Acidimicrobiales bacterium]